MKNFMENYNYVSFDGAIKFFQLGKSFFDAIENEISIIKSTPLFKDIEKELITTPNKNIILKEMNHWKLPHNIFLLMPKWWDKNDIQDMNPSVTAVHQIINQILKT